MIKLVAIDIDGTLVNEKKIMTEKVKKTIHAAMDQGVKIVLCTGRPISGIRPYLEELGMFAEDDFVISQNGAVITRTDTEEIIEVWPFEKNAVEKLYDFGKDFSADFLVMNEEKFYLIVPEKNQKAMRPALISEGETVRMAVDTTTIGGLEGEFVKVLFFGETAEIDEVEAAVPSEFRDDFSVTRSQTYLLEIAAKGINKGTALTKLAQDLGFEREEVMAIGDGNNDYHMIKAAGLGVVMENGTDYLKSVAKELTLSNENDGVAHAIEKFVLK
ncbi:Cof-type HAD-IIB family hydrolase [Jeotgalibaca sp. A127]|uniref:Cof-type HAD-IIB family hydrolase n=1 Tax=Jeotgalibaca sp. A127 TaxID=3457324 RepID=UPI003FD03E66